MKILIVEDDEITLKALEHRLGIAGYTISSAKDGKKALDIYNTEKDFDLIISDIMMPNISGFTLLSTIRDYNQKRVPVILISSLDKAKTITSSLELEVDDIIVKPIDFDQLLLKIEKLIPVKN